VAYYLYQNEKVGSFMNNKRAIPRGSAVPYRGKTGKDALRSARKEGKRNQPCSPRAQRRDINKTKSREENDEGAAAKGWVGTEEG